MARRKYDFNADDRCRVLVWCRRHCCLRGKFAGIGIELAHLDPKSADIDNAIPVCFECHATIGHYNAEHPRGRKYSVPELKARRNQVYDEQTSHLVSPVVCRLKGLPEVHFELTNVGNQHPVKARVTVTLAQGTRSYPVPSRHYDGAYWWNLNPQKTVNGHFALPNKIDRTGSEPLRARIEITLADIYRCEHKLLPEGYVHSLTGGDWYFEPAEEAFSAQKGAPPNALFAPTAGRRR